MDFHKLSWCSRSSCSQRQECATTSVCPCHALAHLALTTQQVALVVTLALLFGGLVALVINYRGHPMTTGSWRGAGKAGCTARAGAAGCTTLQGTGARPPCGRPTCQLFVVQQPHAKLNPLLLSTQPPCAVVDPEAGVEALPIPPKKEQPAADKKQQEQQQQQQQPAAPAGGGGKQQEPAGKQQGTQPEAGAGKNTTEPAGEGQKKPAGEGGRRLMARLPPL